MSTICSQLGMNVKLDSRVVNVFINAERERAFLEYPE